MREAVTCVACCYNLAPEDMQARLEHVAAKIGVSLRGIVVANNPDHDLGARPGWQTIRGSNAIMDFSAYYEGLSALAASGLPQEAVLVLNDTVFTDHNSYWNLKEVLKYRQFVAEVDLPCIVGKVDDYPSVCFHNPWSGLNAYVSSFCFLLNRPGQEAFLRVYERLPEEFPATTLPVTHPDWGKQLDPVFRTYLRLHLTTDFDPNSWYKAKKYNNNSRILQTKAFCVYLEHRLSGEIGRNGVIIAFNAWAKAKVKYFLMERLGKLARAFQR